MSSLRSNDVYSPQQIPLDLPCRTAYGRDDFLIGPENAQASGWIDRWPDWPGPALFITGPAASGKSHLAAVWTEKSGADLIKPDRLVSETAERLASLSPCLVIDGIDLWLGTREAEETLFHLYNIFKEEGRSFLLTSRMAPSHLDFVVPDLASRLRAAPVAQIQPPEDTLLASVLIKLFSDRQLNVSNDVIRYILPRMERSFAAARDLVSRTDILALSNKQKISIPLIRKVLMSMSE